VVTALGLLPLQADGGLVSLDVSAFEQIALQDGGQREQQLARDDDGRIERATRDLDDVVSVLLFPKILFF
jgi:hypothetical protein